MPTYFDTYTIGEVRAALEKYQIRQEFGLDRGTEGQRAAYDKNFDVHRAFVESLNDFEQEVAFWYFLKGLRQVEVGERVGRSQQMVSYYIQGILRKMVRHLNRRAAE